MSRPSAPRVETAPTLLDELADLDAAHDSDAAHPVLTTGTGVTLPRGAPGAPRIGVHTAACWAHLKPEPETP